MTWILAGPPTSVLYLSASITIKEDRGFSATPGVDATCESTNITISPGLIVTNLASEGLFCMPAPALSNRQSVSIPAGSTVPMLDIYQGADLQQHALLVALTESFEDSESSSAAEQSSANAEALENSHASASSETQPGKQAASASSFTDSFINFLEDAAGEKQPQPAGASNMVQMPEWENAVPLSHGLGARRRLHLKDAAGQVMAAWLIFECHLDVYHLYKKS